MALRLLLIRISQHFGTSMPQGGHPPHHSFSIIAAIISGVGSLGSEAMCGYGEGQYRSANAHSSPPTKPQSITTNMLSV
jgi:hypothetical protein